MRVQATKTMAKAINDYTGKKTFSARYVEMNTDNYKFYVGSFFDNIMDYNSAKGVMVAIEITYPAEYYAMPRFLTTKDLDRAFRESDRTFEGFMDRVKEECEI